MSIQVPRYDQQRVQPQPMPQPRLPSDAPLEAFGGGQPLQQVTQAAQETMSSAQKLLLQFQKDADDARMNEVEKQILDFKTDLLMNPETGALSRKGRNALGIESQYKKTFDEFTSRLDQDLASEYQKRRLQEMRLKHEISLSDTLARHVFQEFKSYDDETSKAAINAKANDITLNYSNLGYVDEGLKEVEQKIIEYAARQGKGADQTKAIIDDTRTDIHKNIIKMHLTNDDDLSAEEYYKIYKDQVNAAGKLDIEKMLDEGSRKGKAQRLSAEIYAKNQGNMKKAMDEARSIEDPKLQDETLDRVKKMFSEDKAAERMRREDLFIQAGNIMEKTRNYYAIPSYMRAEFTPQEKNTLRSMENPRTESDLVALNDLNFLASNPKTRDKFKDINLIKDFGSKLSTSDLKHFMKVQNDIRQGKGETETDLNSAFSTTTIIKTALQKAKISEKNKAQYAQAMSEIQTAVNQFQEKQGRKATNDEIQKIVEQKTLEVAIQGKWFGKKKVFQLEPNEIPEPPMAMKIKIAEALKKEGKPITEENILKVFLLKIGAKSGE